MRASMFPGPAWQVVTSFDMVEDKEVDRTIKERLLSWPWQPFKKIKTIKVPSQNVVVDREHFLIVCHPTIEDRVRGQC